MIPEEKEFQRLIAESRRIMRRQNIDMTRLKRISQKMNELIEIVDPAEKSVMNK